MSWWEGPPLTGREDGARGREVDPDPLRALPTADRATGGGVVSAPGSRRLWRDVLHWRNWSLPVKLVAVLLVPTLFALVLGSLRIVDSVSKASSYNGAVQAVTLSDRTATLLAALEQERDAAAVMLATGRVGNPAALTAPSAAVDKAAEATRAAAADLSALDATASAAYRGSADALSGLGRLRAQVTAGAVDAQTAITDYTQVIDALLAFDQTLSRQVTDPAVTGLAAGAHSLAVVREQVALQHAQLAVAIVQGRTDPAGVAAVRAADVARATSLADFKAAVDPDVAQAYATAAASTDAGTRDQLEAVALNRGASGQPLLISASEWDRVSTAVENQVGTLAQGLRQQVRAAVSALQDRARTAAVVVSVILLVALLIGTVVGVVVARSMLRPLRMLRRTALEIAEMRLPRAVEGIRAGEAPDAAVEPVPVTTREEIGQVARAFDAVHGQAVRLAAEQASLRTTFNSIFVNLSRRSQALVERQLRLIEQLEAGEEDPEALGNLFQLDHLATRMRRNSENLLVLAGTELTRRTSRPVPLVDVLRAAVSEVEQYQRVELNPPPLLLVVGKTSADLVHLAAELVENATSFSAPDTRVTISSRQASDGTVVVEILDQGVGMSEVDMTEANLRLANPPTVDLSATRRMGLFVVGRLAARHNIRVELTRAGSGGGVAALVTVPATAVLFGAGEGAPVAGSRSLAASLPLGTPAPSNGAGTVPERSALAGAMRSRTDAVTTGAGVSAEAAGEPARARVGSGPEPASVPSGTGPTGTAGPTGTGPTGSTGTGMGSMGNAEREAGPAPAAASTGAAVRQGAAVPPAGGSSASDLFAPGVAPAGVTSSGADRGIPRRAVPEALPLGRPPLEENTPIFDGLASAWFQEQKPVPVSWASDPGPERPGSPLAGATPTPRPRVPEPEAASSTEFGGCADAGWQAAAKITSPEFNGVTAAGLPKRRPRAQLVPGAAGQAWAGAPPAPPSRSAETVRSRLASYQQGVLEGRHQRRGGVPEFAEPVPHGPDPAATTETRADEECQ